MHGSDRLARRRSGRRLVAALYLGLVALTFLATYGSVRHFRDQIGRHHDRLPQFECLEIVSGDTIRGAQDGRQETVRLLGIDAPGRRPEQVAAGLDPAHEDEVARKVLIGWVLRRKVLLILPPGEPDRDADGRLRAYLDVFGVDAGAKLVQGGQAFASETPHPRLDPYRRFEEQARAAGVGVWRAARRAPEPGR